MFYKHRRQGCFREWTRGNIIEHIMWFHLNPTVEMFNAIIDQDKDLYKEKEDDDLVDELYIELDGENFKARKLRIQKIKEKIQEQKGKPTGDRRANFCDPIILSWANAAVKQFPYLILECNKPLYIERAHNFMGASYYNLLMAVQRGPVQMRLRDTNNPDGVPRIEPKYDAKLRWLSQAYTLWEFRIAQFGASGNTWYIHDTIEILRKYKGGDKIIADGMNQIGRYYNMSANHVYSIKELLEYGDVAPLIWDLIGEDVRAANEDHIHIPNELDEIND